jgi:cytochrome c oxidase assembly protein Cox11
MGVQFMVDPDLPEFIDRITLSYTFFVNRPETAKLAQSLASTGSTT